jgi:hypothetical protein
MPGWPSYTITLQSREGGEKRGQGGRGGGGPVSEVGGHDEVVLDDEGGLLGVQDVSLDHLRGGDALLTVQIR